jgi:hypothetical protein
MFFIKGGVLRLCYRKPVYNLTLVLKEIQGC